MSNIDKMTDLAADQRAFKDAIKKARKYHGLRNQYLWDAGARATRIRDQIPHGGWDDHCRHVLGYSRQWVNKLIQFSEGRTRDQAQYVGSIDDAVKQLSEGSNGKCTLHLTDGDPVEIDPPGLDPDPPPVDENPDGEVVDVETTELPDGNGPPDEPKAQVKTRLTKYDQALLEIDAYRVEVDELKTAAQNKAATVEDLESKVRMYEDQDRPDFLGTAAKFQELENVRNQLKQCKVKRTEQAVQIKDLKTELTNLRRQVRKLMKRPEAAE